MKYTMKILVLTSVFIAALYFFGSNMDEVMFGSVKTTMASEAELPVIELRSDGVTANRLYGYTTAIDMFSVRENMTAVEKEQTVELLIDENKTDVRKLHYEVVQVDSRVEIAEGTINAFDKDGENKLARLKVTGEMESGKEYAVEVMLVDSESRRIYYYFRLKYYEDSCFAEKTTFMRDFSEWARKKEINSVIPFLESTYRGEGSTYAHVDIKDSFYMVCWGNLEPRLLTEPVLNISEVYSNISVGTLRYLVELTTDTGVEQYYITEKFRVIVTASSKHLLNYERTMESVFDVSLASLSQSQLKLGVTNDTGMELLTNSDSSMLAFVRNKELWHYNMAENRLSKVFSMRAAEETINGISDEQYDVRILKQYENGDISFIVYGHMGMGEHEGKTGILLYRYYRGENRIEEQLYLPVSESYQKIKEELGSFSYMNELDVFFFIAYNSMYSYNLITKELSVISDKAISDTVVFSKEDGFVAWQEDYSGLWMLWLESGEKKELHAAEGEFVRILGKINENLICSRGLMEDCMVLGDGSLLYPAYQVQILDENLSAQKTYQKEGVYVAEAEVTNNSIRLQRVVKTSSGRYEEEADDYILNSTEEEKRSVKLDKRITALMFDEYYIDLPSSFDMKEIPQPEAVPYTLISEDTTVRISVLENEAEEYMVYSFGKIVAIGSDCAAAIRKADEGSCVGTVINEAGRVIWERGVKYSASYVKELTGLSVKTSGLSTRQEAVRMLAAYMGQELDVELLGDETEIKEFLEEATGKRILTLTGVTLDEALYFVYKGTPVFAMKNARDAVLITGYSASNVTLYDPANGKYKTASISEAEKMFENAGNIFISYIK